MAEEAKRRIEIEAIEKNQAVQSDGHPGKLESVSPCQGLADCPLVPILQWYLHVCEALEQASWWAGVSAFSQLESYLPEFWLRLGRSDLPETSAYQA